VQLQGNLFKSKTGPCGLDLVSLNIQRGRDHGLPAYPEWREYCGGYKPKTFEELEPIMDSETVERLRSMYDSVDDIDPYTGLVSETPVTSSGILGPTATCVIAEQFLRLKKGDRFWYETPQAPQAFTPGNQYHCLLAKVGIINLFSIASRTTR
jgi:peroxidase